MAEEDDDAGMEPTETRRVSLFPAAMPRRVRPYLTILSGLGAGRMFRIDPEGTVIGRGPLANVNVQDDSVSRRHANVAERAGRLVVEDLGSANGTFVNGEPVEGAPRPLEDGDKIQIGLSAVLRFSYTDELDESFQRAMYDAALRDKLTQTFNKSYLMGRLESEFAYAMRHKAPLGVVMIDIDHFKRVNDTHGHLAGDAVLAEVAARLGQTVRAEDVLARYGGEELTVLARGIPLAGLVQLAERLRAAIAAAPCSFEEKRIPVTVSLGVSCFPEIEVDSPMLLLASADVALVRAKREGRDRVVVAGAGPARLRASSVPPRRPSLPPSGYTIARVATSDPPPDSEPPGTRRF